MDQVATMDKPIGNVPTNRDIDGVERCWNLIKRAVMTHDALPGEKVNQLVAGLDIVRDYMDAYNPEDSPPRKFVPTPRDVTNLLPVLGWLMWLRRLNNGGRDFKILWGRARGLSWWRLAQRFGRSERQVQRWQDGAVAAIYEKFRSQVWDMEPGK